MTDKEVKQALFEAFSAGNYRVNNEHPKEPLQKRFDDWYVRNKMPDKLAELRQPFLSPIGVERDWQEASIKLLFGGSKKANWNIMNDLLRIALKDKIKKS